MATKKDTPRKDTYEEEEGAYKATPGTSPNEYVNFPDEDSVGIMQAKPGSGRNTMLRSKVSNAGAGRGTQGVDEKVEKYEPAKKAKGGAIKKMASGGAVGSASKRADGCATKGKTRGKMV